MSKALMIVKNYSRNKGYPALKKGKNAEKMRGQLRQRLTESKPGVPQKKAR